MVERRPGDGMEVMEVMEVEGPGYLLICYTCINVDAE